jgi:hypothetical protein
MVPIVRYFFGVEVDASTRRVRVNPSLPSLWRRARLERLSLLEALPEGGELSIFYADGRFLIHFTGQAPLYFRERGPLHFSAGEVMIEAPAALPPRA